MLISGFAASSDLVLKYDHIEVLSYARTFAQRIAAGAAITNLDDFARQVQEHLRPLGLFEIHFLDESGEAVETLTEAMSGVTLWVSTGNPPPTIQ